MIDTAQNSLELWQQDERAAFQFARLMSLRSNGLHNLRIAISMFPGPVAEASWRLISLLEYLADLDGAR